MDLPRARDRALLFRPRPRRSRHRAWRGGEERRRRRDLEDQRPGAQADCHSLFAHPRAPELLYEAGGGGFAQSTDFGESWEGADGGMDLHYVWGLAADAEDPSLVYTSAASGPGRA